MQRALVAALPIAALAATMAASTHAAPVTAQTRAAHSATRAAKSPALTPLSDRQRVEQLLDRFTFGARPGDVDAVLEAGTERWWTTQLTPDSIKDDALNRRLGDFPTLGMTPAQALTLFPDRGRIQRVADGKEPMPTDPLLASVYEVQIYKLRQQAAASRQNVGGGVMEPSDAEKAADRQSGQIAAARIAGELFALPRNQRMAALIAMPVEDRIAFTSYAAGDQRTLLLAEFTPHEREILEGMSGNVGTSYFIGQELAQAKMVRAILSERQVQEVMADFWFNHFNVYIAKDSDQWYTTAYERDVIRKYALGHFADLLLATAEDPAMLIYLDNWLSIGPDSLANGVNPKNPRAKPGNRGLNENYGREVMELHTVGVNGGYSQADVTNLSAMLTGWTVDKPYAAGPFVFDAKRHEPGTKTWLGHRIGTGEPFVIQGASPAAAAAAERSAAPMPAALTLDAGSAVEQKALAMAAQPGNEGMREGIEALEILAHSPKTAHFISWKLAQRFVADDPPPALVDRMAATFLSTDGDIKAVLTTLVQSPEFNSTRYFRNKVKTPMEFLVSAYRTTLTDPTNPGALANTMRAMGMPLYFALPPTGYYITADKWMNTGALVDRLNFAYQLTSGRYSGQSFDAAKVVALGLMGESALTEPLAAAPEPAEATAASVRTSAPGHAGARMTPTAARVMAAAPAPVGTQDAVPEGTRLTLGVLEETMIGGPVAAKTNASICSQLEQAPSGPPAQRGASRTEMLNLATALVMGSPEFQIR